MKPIDQGFVPLQTSPLGDRWRLMVPGRLSHLNTREAQFIGDELGEIAIALAAAQSCELGTRRCPNHYTSGLSSEPACGENCRGAHRAIYSREDRF
jgi:hypothetical protein